ncbi:MAG: PHP domain-containing protein [Lachnospiraceae bacterium]|nr:PHP domain-containing protein [Lachnospiraceae bacterium]
MKQITLDYHIHSNFSDGTLCISNILDLIRTNNIQKFSITDHDNIESIPEVFRLLPDVSSYIPGIEFTCSEHQLMGFPFPFSIHLLGYNFDYKNKALNLALKERTARVDSVFSSLLADISLLTNKQITLQEIPISCGVVMQLCDIEAFVQNNFPQYYKQSLPLISSYATPLSEANINITDAINLIHNAGGIAVWAHPFFVYHNFQKKEISFSEVNTILSMLMEHNIDGIEANYFDFSILQQQQLKNLALEKQLIYTCGSDFHGSSHRNHMGIDIMLSDIPINL